MILGASASFGLHSAWGRRPWFFYLGKEGMYLLGLFRINFLARGVSLACFFFLVFSLNLSPFLINLVHVWGRLVA